MNNLDKAFLLWRDLDAKCPKDVTKSQFLRKLVRDGDEASVNGVLNSINVCVKTVEDTEKFNFVKSCLLSVCTRFNDIPEQIDRLGEFVQDLISGKEVVDVVESIIDYLKLNQRPHQRHVDFSKSTYGLEFICADQIELVDEVSMGAIVVKPINKDLTAFNLGNSKFHKRVQDFLSNPKNIKVTPVILMDRDVLPRDDYVKRVGAGFKWKALNHAVAVKLV